jgi:hypothetical protein
MIRALLKHLIATENVSCIVNGIMKKADEALSSVSKKEFAARCINLKKIKDE